MRRFFAWMFAVAACGDASDDASDDAGAAEQREPEDAEAEDAAPALTPTERRRAYLAAWSDCLYATSGRIEQAWKRYGLAVDVDTGMPHDKEKAPFIYRVSVQLESCRIDAPPEGIDASVPAAGAKYVEAASAVAAYTRELSEYYDAGAYVEDAFAKGAATAPAFKAAYDDFVAQQAAFSRTLDTVRAQQDEKWLAELEAAGDEGLRFRVARLALWGRTVAACVAREEAPHTACSPAAKDFHEVQVELDAYCRSHPTEAVGVFWLDVLRRKSELLDEAVTTATTAPKGRPSKPRAKAPTPVELQRGAVADAFAEFVLAADRVRFDFP